MSNIREFVTNQEEERSLHEEIERYKQRIEAAKREFEENQQRMFHNGINPHLQFGVPSNSSNNLQQTNNIQVR